MKHAKDFEWVFCCLLKSYLNVIFVDLIPIFLKIIIIIFHMVFSFAAATSDSDLFLTYFCVETLRGLKASLQRQNFVKKCQKMTDFCHFFVG